jgi:hypothetical protein
MVGSELGLWPWGSSFLLKHSAPFALFLNFDCCFYHDAKDGLTFKVNPWINLTQMLDVLLERRWMMT